MVYIELACFIVGLIAVVIGYRGNKRNVLLIGAMAWLLSGALGDFTQGYMDGLAKSSNTAGPSK